MNADGQVDLVRVLYRGLAILKLFAPNNTWKTNSEIATAVKLPKATVSRITANLTRMGYLEYSEEYGYRLGISSLCLGYAAVSKLDILTVSQPKLQNLADVMNADVVLATPEDMAMVCNIVCSSHHILTLKIGVGSRLTLQNSAMGRALIGALPEHERQPLLDQIRKRDPKRWITLEEELLNAVSEMKNRNFYISIGTLETGVNGIATILDLPFLQRRYALGLAGPAFRLPRERLSKVVAPLLMKAKLDIEKDMSMMAPSSEFPYH